MTDLCPVCVSPAAGAGAGASAAGAGASAGGAGAGAGGGKFSLNDIIKVFVFVREHVGILLSLALLSLCWYLGVGTTSFSDQGHCMGFVAGSN